MIPENKQLAVTKALQTAFEVNEFESIQLLTKGLSSALVSKIIVHGNPYLLRVITRTDDVANPAHYFGCMKTAAEAGLAPRIHYMNIEDRISITDFIQEHPFPITEAKDKLVDMLRQLHALPKFPHRLNYLDTMDGFIAKFRTSNIIPDSVTKDILTLYTRIQKVYPRNDEENQVSCHNDLKPDNIIFDGLRPWLVDWEAAFLNDRYAELAMLANFVVKNDKEETDYLCRYFGEPVNEYQHARFFLMSQSMHLFYFAFCMLVGAAGKPVDVHSINKISFKEFHDSLWNVTISLASNEAKIQYAWVHMQQALHNMNTKRFEEALHIVSGYNKLQ